MSLVSGRELLRAVKAAAGTSPPALVVPVGWPPLAWLRPAGTRKDRLDARDVSRLTAWRNSHLSAFLTEFEATEARTAQWLTEVVHQDPGRILFMLDSPGGETFGYMGLAFIDWSAHEGEADAIVRGSDAVPGAMSRGLKALLQWGYDQLGLQTLAVRVRSNNAGAIRFYERVGFEETRRVPLRRVEEPALVRWAECGLDEGSGVYLVHMRHRRAKAGDRA